MQPRTLHVSEGNSKLGQVPSISFDPHLTCDPSWPCAKKCYAKKLAKFRPNVRQNWIANTAFLINDPKGFEREVIAWLMSKSPKLFRWTVGGEWFKPAHAAMVKRIARKAKNTKFFMYTRRDDYDWKNLPPNLNVFFSYWIDDHDRKPKQKPWAIISDNKPTLTHHSCNDGCDKCGWCTKQTQENIWFKTH